MLDARNAVDEGRRFVVPNTGYYVQLDDQLAIGAIKYLRNPVVRCTHATEANARVQVAEYPVASNSRRTPHSAYARAGGAE